MTDSKSTLDDEVDESAVPPWRAAWMAFVATSDPGRDLSGLAQGDDVDPQWRAAWTAAARAATGSAAKHAVAASYRHLAVWMDTANADEALRVAGMVERYDVTDICCPCCQEIECDDGCPLEPIRTEAAS